MSSANIIREVQPENPFLVVQVQLPARDGAQMPECVILDFDGTFTLVDEEAAPFLVGFKQDLAKLVGQGIKSWDATEAHIRATPDNFGWEYNGLIVAPSHADPYIMATTVGQLLLKDAGVDSAHTRHEQLNAIFKSNYPKAGIAFRSDAKFTLQALQQTGIPVFVVTNSQTDHVTAKIATLKLDHTLRVFGDARKFVVEPPDNPSPMYDALPEHTTYEGLHRPIYLRRGKYLDVLRKIWSETNLDPSSTLVCGDIFELDLAMPAALGYQVHLVTRPATAEYEKRAVRALGGTVSDALSGLLSALDFPG